MEVIEQKKFRPIEVNGPDKDGTVRVEWYSDLLGIYQYIDVEKASIPALIAALKKIRP